MGTAWVNQAWVRRAIVALTLFGLSACAFAEERPTLTIAIPTGSAPYNEPAIERFARLHDVDVEIILMPGAGAYVYELVTNRVAAGLNLDVVHVTTDSASALADAGLSADLGPYLERDPDLSLSDFVPWAIRSFTGPSGEVRALIQNLTTEVLVANLTMLAEAGLDSPSRLAPSEWTWQRLTEYAQAATRLKNDGTPQAYGLQWSSSFLRHLVLQTGKGIFDDPIAPSESNLLSPESVAAHEMWVEWHHPNPVAAPSGGLASGNIAMQMIGSASILNLIEAELLFEWDIVPLALGPANRALDMQIGGPMLLTSSKHPDFAWELVKFYATDPEIVRGMAAFRFRPPGYIPNIPLFNSENFHPKAPGGMNLIRDLIVDPANRGRPGFPGYLEWDAEYRRLFTQEGMRGLRSVRELLEEADQLARATIRALGH